MLSDLYQLDLWYRWWIRQKGKLKWKMLMLGGILVLFLIKNGICGGLNDVRWKCEVKIERKEFKIMKWAKGIDFELKNV